MRFKLLRDSFVFVFLMTFASLFMNLAIVGQKVMGQPAPGPVLDMAEFIRMDTTNFNGHLSSADSDVQKALETLDDLVAGGHGNGANCSAGNFPLGVDENGAVESCTDAWTEAENTSAGYYNSLSDLQTAVSNDFHNLGGTDDDVPDSGDLGLIDTEAEFESELFPIFTPDDGALDDDDITDDASTSLTDTGNIAYLNSAENISGVWEIQDDTLLNFGNSADGGIQHVSSSTTTRYSGVPFHFGADGTGADVVFNSDTSGAQLTYDPSPANATTGHLIQDVYNGQMVYWELSGSNNSTSTSSKGHLNIDVDFTGSYSSLQGANALYFDFADARNISGSFGATGTRIASGKIARTGTHSGSSTAESTQMLYMDMGDGMTLSGTPTVSRTFADFLGTSIQGVSSTGATSAVHRGVHLHNGYIVFATGGGTHTFSHYGVDIANTFSEVEVSGTVNGTNIGVWYHPTMSSTPVAEYAFKADRSIIALKSDGSTGAYAGGRAVFGAGEDAEIYYDGTDLIIDAKLVGSGAVDIESELEVDDLNTGGNAGTDLCHDANGRLCACGSCA
ncbi:MAG: hypothetical protein [Siphoviridae sp. ctCJE6]|nr:MAG: hypothetical protein [Siphoviridae sp. ctCJE6]